VTGAVDEAALNFQFGELPQELSRTTYPFPRPSRFSAMACRIHQHTVAFVTAARQGVVLPCLRLRTFEGLPDYQACSSLALLANTAYLYTANDVRLTLFKGGTAHRPLSYLLWAQYTLSGGRL